MISLQKKLLESRKSKDFSLKSTKRSLIPYPTYQIRMSLQAAFQKHWDFKATARTGYRAFLD